MQQFHGDSPLCPMLLSLLGTGIFLEEAVHGERAGMSLLSCVVVCHRKMATKGIQATVPRDYRGIVMHQNILVLGNLLLVLGFNAFLKERDDTLPILSDLPYSVCFWSVLCRLWRGLRGCALLDSEFLFL